MNRHGFINLVLVLTFLFSNFGGISSNQTSSATTDISWKIKGEIHTILGRIDSWIDGMMTNTFGATEVNPSDISAPSTPTPGLGIVPTIEPTQRQKPTLTPTITPTFTPTESPVITPTIQPTPEITSTIQPTPEITSTIQPTPEITSTILITLTANPERVTPGYPISINWKISGLIQNTNESELVINFPPSFSPVLTQKDINKWKVDGQSLRIPLDMNQGSITFNVAEDTKGPFIVKATLIRSGQDITKTELSLMEDDLTLIGPNGGEASGIGGRVKVSFPPNSALGITEENPMAVRVRLPTSKANAPYYPGGMPFEVIAEQQSHESGEETREINEFTGYITITVNYSGTQFIGEDENALTINYYDEDLTTWIPLTSYVDTDLKVITAYSDHLTLFDVNAQNWEAARLPSLKDFQVSQFTGAATYSFPIEVPPGPGGLQPSLSLNYNSLSVDNASGATQASWVGMGWSIDTGSIVRNQHGTMYWLDDDTFTLELNGQSSVLLKGTDGYYHSTNENFLRIQFDSANDRWNIWDKSGTKYIFGDPDRASYPNFYDPANCLFNYITWKWGLSKVQNIFGQTLTYTYTKNTNPGIYHGGSCNSNQYFFDAAMYPLEIRYPNNYYRIFFEQDSLRKDYDGAWDADTARTFYQKNKLNSIRIQYNPDGDSGFNNLTDMRRYDLVYASGSDPFIFPGYTWTKGDKTLTLLQIKEYGWNGYGPLPATSFTYGDGMHLTQAENGYGGEVSFNYEAWSETDGPESQTIWQSTNQQYIGPCAYNPPGLNNTGGWGGASCAHSYSHPNDWWLLVTGRASMAIPPGLFHPGGKYQLHATFTDTWDNIQLGLFDGQVDHLGTI